MSASLVLEKLYAALWEGYKIRVPYAAQYQAMAEAKGGRLRNDHIAFRTFNCTTGSQPAGVESIARIFEALGYTRRDQYLFADKHLTAWHWQHVTNDAMPKIFISQLEVDRLPPEFAGDVRAAVVKTVDLVSRRDIEILSKLSTGAIIEEAEASLLAERLVKFFIRPWEAPSRKLIETIDPISQYAAWTLLHGNSVNHFTAYINEQAVKEWADIEATVAALKDAGIPMKPEFEGERGSKLRQSSTKAAMEDCEVQEEGGTIGKINWSYAYYELAERGDVPGQDGRPTRFQAFLGAQATNLFDMTKRG